MMVRNAKPVDFRIPDTVKVHGLEVFNSADKDDRDGERTRLRFVNAKR
jgi:hypothetical protein